MNRYFLAVVLILVSLSFIVSPCYACNQLPKAEIVNPFYQFICVGNAASFDGVGSCVYETGSHDPDNLSPYGCGHGIDIYGWWYGYGNWDYSSGGTPSHPYNTAGVYGVYLYVYDDDGDGWRSLYPDSCVVYVVEVNNVEAGGKDANETLYLANNYLDEPNERAELSQSVQATLNPDVGTPDCFSWSPVCGSLPKICPDDARTATFTVKDHGNYPITATCGSSSESMNIAVEGVDIKTANISDADEMTETYNIFLNENFDQELNPTNPPGHTTCYDQDHSDDSWAGDSSDELGTITLITERYGDTSAEVKFDSSSAIIKLYKSSTEKLDFGTYYLATSLPGSLKVEGTSFGTTTLTATIKTQDDYTATDELKIKVISLYLITVVPAVSDAHEICHKDKLFIPVNDNDSDADGTLDSVDDEIPGGDPDLKKILLAVPYAVASDISGSITVTFPGSIWAYENNDKTGWSETGGSKSFSLSDLPEYIYLEGRAHSDVLDAKVKVAMTLDSGVVCRDEIRYTVIKVDMHATDLDDGTVFNRYEENPGAYVHFNLDNDNSSDNSVPSSKHPGADYLETTNPVTGENDLKLLTMSLLPSLDFGSMVLSIPSCAKIWEDPEKGSSNLVLASGSKTWDLSVENERNKFLSLCSSLYVEGVNTGTGNIVLKYKNLLGSEIVSDKVKYTFIAADCGDQPRTDDNYGGPGISERNAFEGAFSSLIRCEWSVTDHDPDGVYPDYRYNCIASSVDEYSFWYNPDYIDIHYGDNNGIFEDSDMDAFYNDKKDWSLITSGSDEEKADDAEAMYYSYGVDWDYLHDPPPGSGYHAAREKSCSCGAGKWIMFESKCGPMERIEHVWDQLNASNYGDPDRFYK